MNKNNGGNSTVILIAAIATVLLLGFLIYTRINSADEDSTSSNSTAQSSEEEVIESEDRLVPEGWTEISEDDFGISLLAPEEWNYEKNNDVKYSEDNLDNLNSYTVGMLYSPDYKTGLRQGSETGIAGVAVSVRYTLLSKTNDRNELILKGTQSTFPYDDPEEIIDRDIFIAGDLEGVKFEKSIDPERDDVARYTVYRFEKDDKVIIFELESQNATKSKNSKTVDSIIRTLEIN